MQKIKIGSKVWLKESHYDGEIARDNRRKGVVTGFNTYPKELKFGEKDKGETVEKYQVRVGGKRLGWNAHNQYCLEKDLIELK